MNLSDLFAIPTQRTHTKVALSSTPIGGAETDYTYADLWLRAEKVAAFLQKKGIGKGDRVAFYVGNRPEFLIVYLALLRLGAVMVPINLRYRRGEIAPLLADSTPKLMVTEAAQLPILQGLNLENLPFETTLVVERLAEWEADPAGVVWPTVDGDDPAMIIYTSGTTGRSKGAVISHNNVLATVTGLLAAWAWQADDVLLLTLPLFHVHGLVVGLHCALAAGATTLLRPKFEGEATLAELLGSGAAKPTLFFAVPTIYVRLVQMLGEGGGSPDLSHMRLFCSGSAPLAPETHQAFHALTGHTILERYGMTETGMNFSNPYAGPRLPGTVGTPLPGVSMRIVDKSNRDLAAGEEGELLLRGGNVFDGYWQAPEKTASSFSLDPSGRRWFHTGDLARLDPETGYLTLLGRSHELIISGGFNIYPREIEEMLAAYPGIAEAAVVGRPHVDWGEVPVAYVVCAGPLDEAGLIAHCRRELASFKVPQAFHVIDELPRNAMGKIQKHLLPKEG
ncbi:MAG: AMP-binding protein [Caldilineaceae bacterium]|nr:AMP-binding protein [Caldilineaceae bacterium]